MSVTFVSFNEMRLTRNLELLVAQGNILDKKFKAAAGLKEQERLWQHMIKNFAWIKQIEKRLQLEKSNVSRHGLS